MYLEAKLEDGGDSAPQHVRRSLSFGEIIRVAGVLLEM